MELLSPSKVRSSISQNKGAGLEHRVTACFRYGKVRSDAMLGAPGVVGLQDLPQEKD